MNGFHKTRSWPITFLIIVLIVAVVAGTYLLWQKEYLAKTGEKGDMVSVENANISNLKSKPDGPIAATGIDTGDSSGNETEIPSGSTGDDANAYNAYISKNEYVIDESNSFTVASTEEIIMVGAKTIYADERVTIETKGYAESSIYGPGIRIQAKNLTEEDIRIEIEELIVDETPQGGHLQTFVPRGETRQDTLYALGHSEEEVLIKEINVSFRITTGNETYTTDTVNIQISSN